VPVTQRWHFICPITGADAAQDATGSAPVLPARWARIADEVYSPEGMGILARRILAHPDAEYVDVMMAQFPSTKFDDWQQQPVPPVETPPVVDPVPAVDPAPVPPG
jgi:hypothetical protein